MTKPLDKKKFTNSDKNFVFATLKLHKDTKILCIDSY